jgi:predicted flap endonuclease-1-like 5' DNA nuclease
MLAARRSPPPLPPAPQPVPEARREPPLAPPVVAPRPAPAAAPPLDRALDAQLELVRGIDPATAARLRSAGVATLTAIAGWTAADIARLAPKVGGRARIVREGWIEQAAALAGGRITRHARRVLDGEMEALAPAPSAPPAAPVAWHVPPRPAAQVASAPIPAPPAPPPEPVLTLPPQEPAPQTLPPPVPPNVPAPAQGSEPTAASLLARISRIQLDPGVAERARRPVVPPVVPETAPASSAAADQPRPGLGPLDGAGIRPVSPPPLPASVMTIAPRAPAEPADPLLARLGQLESDLAALRPSEGLLAKLRARVEERAGPDPRAGAADALPPGGLIPDRGPLPVRPEEEEFPQLSVGEADVEIVATAPSAAPEPAVPPRAAPRRTRHGEPATPVDADSYAAYHSQIEEASVEIVRPAGNRAENGRSDPSAPGAPPRVNRFLKALTGD